MSEHVGKNNKKILCLDFDGVIHSYTSGWQGDVRTMNDPIVPGTIEFLEVAVKEWDVQVYSSRSDNPMGIQAMIEYIYRHAYEYYGGVDASDLAHTLAARLISQLSFPNHKPPAYVALDDRVLNFDGNWPSMETLRNFKPWYKKEK